jgi:alkaline phosphatase D
MYLWERLSYMTKMEKGFLSAFTIALFCFASCKAPAPDGPSLATGIKIGEVTQTSAIIWTRLTEDSVRIGTEAPEVEVYYPDPETGELMPRRGRPDIAPVVRYPEGYDVHTIEGATPGREGKVRVQYRPAASSEWSRTEWQRVDPQKDFTYQFQILDLEPGTEYHLLVEASALNAEAISATLEGKFKTPAPATMEQEVNFIVTTGTSYPDVDSETGYKFCNSALKTDPEFFVHTGDILYYDSQGKSLDLALWHWARMYSLPNHINFHRQVPSYFIKDDHDTWMNDCYPGMETKFMGEFTYEQGTEVFLYEVPMGEKTYRTVRWGKDLQIWMVEGRDYRSPNPMTDGPDKTIWGAAQMQWFQSTVQASDARFKVLMSPTPVVGPDRERKNDNHANEGFAYEGNILRDFLKEQNMVVVCGDRHWQYISRDDKTGLLEFSCGPGGNDHAGGWDQDSVLPEHIYLNVVGGFMEGHVSYDQGLPFLTFRHYDPDGVLLNEHKIESTYFE